MDAIKWLEENEKHFSIDMNGYSSPPIRQYISTLPLIDRDGKTMDLGSGNAMLLKFLMHFSNHQLIPYGIDLNEHAIKEAKQKVLPEFAEQFSIENVINHNFSNGPYSIIISNPFYSSPQMRRFTEKCLDNLDKGGRLIYRIHDDVLSHNKINKLEDLSDFKNLGMKVSRGYDLSFCTFDK